MAIAIFDKAMESDRQDYHPIVGKALGLRDQGKDAEAKPLFVSAEALAPAQFKDRIKQLAAGKPPTPAAPTVAPGASPAPTASPQESPSPSAGLGGSPAPKE